MMFGLSDFAEVNIICGVAAIIIGMMVMKCSDEYEERAGMWAMQILGALYTGSILFVFW